MEAGYEPNFPQVNKKQIKRKKKKKEKKKRVGGWVRSRFDLER